MSEYLFQRAFLEAQKLSEEKNKVCLEFGVGWGGTFKWYAEQIKLNFPDTVLIGFDSWQGLPPEEKGVWFPERHNVGAFSFSKNVVLAKLKELGLENDDRFKFVDGFYSESLTPEIRSTINNVIFINIDVDLYTSTISVLDFVKPLLQKNTILYFDDWKDPKDKHDGEWGEHLAWKVWSEKNPEIIYETMEINKYNQRYIKIL